MIFGKSKLELKVGIFVFVGLAVLLVFIVLIGDYKSLFAGYKINVVFNFINGVKAGAPVRFAGLDVGEVKKINLLFSPEEQKNKVELVCWIKQDIKIPSDSSVWVNTLGLLGEKYIEIMPGKDYKNYIKDNFCMVGNDPVAMQEFGELAKSIAKKLDDSLIEIKSLASSAKNLSDNLDESITKIKNKEGTLGKLIYDDQLYNQINALVEDVRKHPWKLFWKTKEK
jgi:phospholipid/cholesterol/gamma-HCH transport system substrate-binding protein